MTDFLTGAATRPDQSPDLDTYLMPLAGGEASLGFNVVPGQSKSLQAQWAREVLGGNVGLQFGYDQPNEGRPNWRVGLGGRIPF